MPGADPRGQYRHRDDPQRRYVRYSRQRAGRPLVYRAGQYAAGLFFTGFSQEQANPDMGDSAITETFGIGGAAMIAAPGVTRFVGAGGMEAAKSVSEEMAEIFLERNMQLQIPGWDFQGACLGLDIRRVVETGITPLINTGIAHKEAGIGQIGAGTVRAPLACFELALEALADELGVS
jgi:hypothetical protein